MLERLVHQFRVVGAEPGGFLEAPLVSALEASDAPVEPDQTKEFRAAEANLLSEIE